MPIESSEQLGNETQSSPESESSNNESSNGSSNQELQDAMAELEKFEKFKFQGQEWTPKDLEKAILRQKDYTQKTQTLAEERRTLDSQREEEKFYTNLYYDLNAVKQNPSLASEFLRTYPEKFHGYLKDVLSNDQGAAQSKDKQTPSQQQDIELLMKVQKMEKFIHEQEVAKQTAFIDSQITKLSAQYPDAMKDVAIARIYEMANAGKKISEADWEKAFSDSETQVKDMLKAKYGEKVKQQTAVNRKSRDVDTGGGTVGRAPQKVSGFKEATAMAIRDLTQK